MGEEGQRGYAKLLGKRMIEQADANGSNTLTDELFDEIVTALPANLGRVGGGASIGEGGCFVTLGSAKSLSRHHATIDWDFEQGSYRINCLSKNGMVVDKIHYNKDEHALLKDKSAIRVGPVNFYFHLPPQVEGGEEEEGEDGGEEDSGGDDEMDGDELGGGEDVTGDEQSEMGGGTATSSMNLDPAANPALLAAAGGKPAAPQRRPPLPKPQGSASYSDLVFAAFISSELSPTAESTGVTSSEVSNYIFAKYPEWATPEQRKRQLQNGVQNVLTRKFIKQEATANQPSGQRGARWKMDPKLRHLAVPVGAQKGVAPAKEGGSDGGGGGGGSQMSGTTGGGGQGEEKKNESSAAADEEDIMSEDEDDEEGEDDDDNDDNVMDDGDN